jgi:hypothetical protein
MGMPWIFLIELAAVVAAVDPGTGAGIDDAGTVGSMMIENTSESSIRPCLMLCQLAPPSVVFHGRCQVPA